MSFSYDGPVTLNHINTRKQGPEDDKQVFVDLKIELRDTADALAHFDTQLDTFVFNDKREVRFPNMGAISWKGQVVHCELKIYDLDFTDVTAKNFSFTPYTDKTGTPMVEISCGLTFPKTGKALDILSEYLGEEIEISLMPQPELDLGEAKPVAKPIKAGSNVSLFDNGSMDSADWTTADPLYVQALAFVRESGRPSVSFVQRKFKIGYNRAARLIEKMEAEGAVTPMQGNGQRDVVRPQ